MKLTLKNLESYQDAFKVRYAFTCPHPKLASIYRSVLKESRISFDAEDSADEILFAAFDVFEACEAVRHTVFDFYSFDSLDWGRGHEINS
jgi:hypothetical protein